MTGFAEIHGNQGNDAIDVTNYGFAKVIGGTGNDRITVTNGNQSYYLGVAHIYGDDPNGSLEKITNPAAYLNTPPTIQLIMAGNSYDGPPLFDLIIDGKVVAARQAVTADAAKGEKQTFTYTLPNLRLAQQVQVRFLNDKWAGPGLDRNIHLFSVTLDGKTLANKDATFVVSGNRPSNAYQQDGRNLLWGTGTLTYATGQGAPVTPIQPPPLPQPPLKNTITVVAAGDSYLGNPVMRVSLDGKVIGVHEVTASRSLGQSQTFTFNVGDIRDVGSLNIEMTNDRYGGPGLDRNLLVRSVLLNGSRLNNQQASYNGRGPNRQGEHFLNGGGKLVYGLSPYKSLMAQPIDTTPKVTVSGPDADTIILKSDDGNTPLDFSFAKDGNGNVTKTLERSSQTLVAGGQGKDAFVLEAGASGVITDFTLGEDLIATRLAFNLVDMLNGTLISFNGDGNGAFGGVAVAGVTKDQLADHILFATV